MVVLSVVCGRLVVVLRSTMMKLAGVSPLPNEVRETQHLRPGLHISATLMTASQ